MIGLCVGLVLCSLLGTEGSLGEKTGEMNDPDFQQQLNRQFAEMGVDRSDLRTTRAQHTAFVGSSPRARQLGAAFEARRFASMMAARTTSRSSPSSKSEQKDFVQHEWLKMVHLPEVGVCSDRYFKCDRRRPFRSVDGSCNNLENPTWGKSFIQMRRFLPPQYEDGISSPRVTGSGGFPLPSARLVSTTVHDPDDRVPKLRGITNMLMQWGQFLDHDLTLAPVKTGMGGRPLTCCPEDVPSELREGLNVSMREGCFPIEIPPGDRRFPNRRCMQFPRSIQVNNAQCTGVPAEQLNQLTAYVDASNVYGSDEEEANRLRSFVKGLLKTSDNNLLPFNNDTLEVCTARCFRAGDERSNEQMGLASIHTLFVREHNRIARTLHKINPKWNDERLYQEARKILGAIMQKITYNDFLPLVLNKVTRHKNSLISPFFGFNNVYSQTTDASIRNAFAAAAYRFGHSLLRSLFSRLRPNFSTRKVERLRDLFGNSKLLIDSKGQAVNELLRGKLLDRASRVDRFITTEVTDFLFATTNNSLDLAALNIQRARDHGVPGYTAWRKWCGLSDVTNFGTGQGGLVDHDPQTALKLKTVYRDPKDIDLFTGGISEIPLKGGLLGPTFSCLVARQFSLLKKGDRFWFENDDFHIGFTAGQLKQIRRASLSRIICDNTDTFFLQPNAFRIISRRNRLLYCQQLPRVNLYEWDERFGGSWSAWSGWSGCRYGAPVTFRKRKCLSEEYRCPGSNIEQSRCNYFVYFKK